MPKVSKRHSKPSSPPSAISVTYQEPRKCRVMGDRTIQNQLPRKPRWHFKKCPTPGHGRVAAKTIRLSDKDHRKFVSRQPCVVCGRTPVDPHHLRFAQPRALSRKVSDEFLVPVCRLH